jgi:hypothetical protein
MRGDGGNHHEKLGLKRILCPSQLTIPDTAVTTPDPAGKHTDIRSSNRDQASHTPDFSYRLVSSIFVPIYIADLSFSTIIADHKVKSSLSISPCHDHELTLSTAYIEYSIHRVQHKPSTVYTEYSIRRVLHTQSTAYTQDCLTSLHSHDHQWTPECIFKIRPGSPQDRPPPGCSP